MAEVLEVVIPQISCSQCFPIGELIPHSSSLGRGPLSLWVKKWGPRRHRDAWGVDPVSCLYTSELLQLPVAVLFPEPTVAVSPLSPLRRVFGKMETRNTKDRKLR